MTVTYRAYAKINLMLDILSRLDNGYHSLFMVMQSVSLADTVSVSGTGDGSISVTCNEPDIPTDEHNIVHKAATAFFRDTGIDNPGIRIDIDKRIPFAAGLAGGSTDAAATLCALNTLFGTGLSTSQLCTTGVKIGADVPFCLTGGTALAQNVGEILSPLPPLPDCTIVLAKPDAGVSTGEAYGAFDSAQTVRHLDTCGMLYAASRSDLLGICKKAKNVFEQLIETPERVPIKSVMNRFGALCTCMSGSGPTVFGIFDDESGAAEAAEALRSVVSNVFVVKPVSGGPEQLININ